MKKVMVMVVALVFGICSLAVACGGCRGYGFGGGAGMGYSGGYGPGSCCSFASNTQAANCCLPGTPGFSRGNTNPGAASGTIAPQSK